MAVVYDILNPTIFHFAMYQLASIDASFVDYTTHAVHKGPAASSACSRPKFWQRKIDRYVWTIRTKLLDVACFDHVAVKIYF